MPLSNLDKLKKHKPELKAITKSVYPRDSTRFWNQVYTAVEGGHRKLVEGQAAKTRPHLYADDAAPGAGVSDAVRSVAGDDETATFGRQRRVSSVSSRCTSGNRQSVT